MDDIPAGGYPIDSWPADDEDAEESGVLLFQSAARGASARTVPSYNADAHSPPVPAAFGLTASADS